MSSTTQSSSVVMKPANHAGDGTREPGFIKKNQSKGDIGHQRTPLGDVEQKSVFDSDNIFESNFNLEKSRKFGMQIAEYKIRVISPRLKTLIEQEKEIQRAIALEKTALKEEQNEMINFVGYYETGREKVVLGPKKFGDSIKLSQNEKYALETFPAEFGEEMTFLIQRNRRNHDNEKRRGQEEFTAKLGRLEAQGEGAKALKKKRQQKFVAAAPETESTEDEEWTRVMSKKEQRRAAEIAVIRKPRRKPDIGQFVDGDNEKLAAFSRRPLDTRMVTYRKEKDSERFYKSCKRAQEKVLAAGGSADCRFGEKCRYAGCRFLHPKKRSTKLYNKTEKIVASRQKKKCMFGLNCTRKGCIFVHPAEFHGVAKPFTKVLKKQRSETSSSNQSTPIPPESLDGLAFFDEIQVDKDILKEKNPRLFESAAEDKGAQPKGDLRGLPAERPEAFHYHGKDYYPGDSVVIATETYDVNVNPQDPNGTIVVKRKETKKTMKFPIESEEELMRKHQEKVKSRRGKTTVKPILAADMATAQPESYYHYYPEDKAPQPPKRETKELTTKKSVKGDNKSGHQ